MKHSVIARRDKVFGEPLPSLTHLLIAGWAAAITPFLSHIWFKPLIIQLGKQPTISNRWNVPDKTDIQSARG